MGFVLGPRPLVIYGPQRSEEDNLPRPGALEETRPPVSLGRAPPAPRPLVLLHALLRTRGVRLGAAPSSNTSLW